MINIVGIGLSQWDTGRIVKVTDSEATHVHFANPGDSHAVIRELQDGETKIPAYLLQTGKALNAYAVLDKGNDCVVTLETRAFAVRKREKPRNYVYEDDQRNYIYTLIEDAKAAADAANKVAKDLRDAKDRGEFNGPKGDPGEGSVKTVNGVSPDENGNVDLQNSLIVTFDFSNNTSSHDTRQIREAADKGVNVYACVYDSYAHLSAYGDDYASFIRFTDENIHGFYEVYNTNEFVEHEFQYATQAAFDGLVEDLHSTVKSVNGIAPDANGNLELKNAFIVNINLADMTSDSGPSEFLWHVLNEGGPVFARLHFLGDDLGQYIPLSWTNGETAFFLRVSDDNVHDLFIVDENYEVQRFELDYSGFVRNVDFDKTVGDISAALDHIIALQEELIGT